MNEFPYDSENIPLKHCPRCNRDLPATTEYFYRSQGRRFGLNWQCKSCGHDEVIAKAEANPDWHKERHQRQRARELTKSSEDQASIRARKAKSMREYRAKRRQTGICTSCYIRPAVPGRRCDICRTQMAQWVKDNPEHIKSSHKQIRDKLRQQVLTAYGNKCICCGETHAEFLTVDHVNNDGAEHRRILRESGTDNIYRWLRQNGFPQEGFQLLCHNCNFAKYAYSVCPHQRNIP